jgi:hypothetical protein
MRARARIVDNFAMAHAVQRYDELYASLGVAARLTTPGLSL